jgi:DNA-binding response OmpR family regulator
MKLLLLEDDQILCNSLQEFLELEGHDVDTAHRGEEVFDLTFKESYDLYILDVNVPEVNGFDILQALREAGDETPAIYITALTDINSISKGFDAGAEDYIKKPFDPEELALRIRNRFQKRETLIHHGDIRYDPVSGTLRKGDKTIGLGEVQMKIFHTLITQRDTIVGSYTLMDYLGQPSANALRVNLAKLKSKLGIEIKNIRGQGYMIESV